MSEEYGSNSLPFRVITLPSIIFAVLAVLVVMIHMSLFFKVLLLVAGVGTFIGFIIIRIDHYLTMEHSTDES